MRSTGSRLEENTNRRNGVHDRAGCFCQGIEAADRNSSGTTTWTITFVGVLLAFSEAERPSPSHQKCIPTLAGEGKFEVMQGHFRAIEFRAEVGVPLQGRVLDAIFRALRSEAQRPAIQVEQVRFP